MSAARRAEIEKVAVRHGLMVIEDDVNAHMHDEPWVPLAAEMPDQVVYISSLSRVHSETLIY